MTSMFTARAWMSSERRSKTPQRRKSKRCRPSMKHETAQSRKRRTSGRRLSSAGGTSRRCWRRPGCGCRPLRRPPRGAPRRRSSQRQVVPRPARRPWPPRPSRQKEIWQLPSGIWRAPAYPSSSARSRPRPTPLPPRRCATKRRWPRLIPASVAGRSAIPSTGPSSTGSPASAMRRRRPRGRRPGQALLPPARSMPAKPRASPAARVSRSTAAAGPLRSRRRCTTAGWRMAARRMRRWPRPGPARTKAPGASGR